MKRIIRILIFVLLPVITFSQEELTHDVFFDTDSYAIKIAEKQRLLPFITNLKNININGITILGFCDDRGTEAYNLKLSNSRANTIKTFLVNQGIDASQISNVDGKGEVLLKIVNSQTTKEIRRLNRKSRIIVSYTIKPSESTSLKSIEEDSINETVKILKEELHVGDQIVLKNILFKNGYSIILPESKDDLKEIAKVLVEKDNVYFTIQGHVCCTYKTRDAIDAVTKKRNLSVARAKFIYDYLAKEGVRKNRMRYEGLRRKFPLGGDPKEDRRVEIKITLIAKRD